MYEILYEGEYRKAVITPRALVVLAKNPKGGWTVIRKIPFRR
jgi:ketosteroid isomerase-like protein